MTNSIAARPWYREPMVFLVFGLPLTVVVASLITLSLAISAGASDSTRESVSRVGKGQTADIAPDRLAARLGLTARLERAPDSEAIRVELAGVAIDANQLRLLLTHPISADQDAEAILVRSGASQFSGRLQATSGHAWNLQLQSLDGDWRLQGRLPRDAASAELAPAVDDG